MTTIDKIAGKKIATVQELGGTGNPVLITLDNGLELMVTVLSIDALDEKASKLDKQIADKQAELNALIAKKPK
jgi:hypothetical protein